MFPGVPITAATASAPPCMREEIKSLLGISNFTEFIDSVNRANTTYEAQWCMSSKEVLKSIAAVLRMKPNDTGIIYCATRKETENVCNSLLDLLQGSTVTISFYHRKVPDEEKIVRLKAWLKHDLKVMVATTAMGMGVDNPEVRFVYHFTMPPSKVDFQQESGRGGRAPNSNARSVVFYNFDDLQHHKRMILFPTDDNGNPIEADPHVQRKKLHQLDLMYTYIDSFKCRRAGILEFFGEEYSPNSLLPCCDNCTRAQEIVTIDMKQEASFLWALLNNYRQTTKPNVTVKQIFAHYSKQNREIAGLQRVLNEQEFCRMMHGMIQKGIVEDDYQKITYLAGNKPQHKWQSYIKQSPSEIVLDNFPIQFSRHCSRARGENASRSSGVAGETLVDRNHINHTGTTVGSNASRSSGVAGETLVDRSVAGETLVERNNTRNNTNHTGMAVGSNVSRSNNLLDDDDSSTGSWMEYANEYTSSRPPPTVPTRSVMFVTAIPHEFDSQGRYKTPYVPPNAKCYIKKCKNPPINQCIGRLDIQCHFSCANHSILITVEMSRTWAGYWRCKCHEDYEKHNGANSFAAFVPHMFGKCIYPTCGHKCMQDWVGLTFKLCMPCQEESDEEIMAKSMTYARAMAGINTSLVAPHGFLVDQTRAKGSYIAGILRNLPCFLDGRLTHQKRAFVDSEINRKGIVESNSEGLTQMTREYVVTYRDRTGRLITVRILRDPSFRIYVDRPHALKYVWSETSDERNILLSLKEVCLRLRDIFIDCVVIQYGVPDFHRIKAMFSVAGLELDTSTRNLDFYTEVIEEGKLIVTNAASHSFVLQSSKLACLAHYFSATSSGDDRWNLIALGRKCELDEEVTRDVVGLFDGILRDNPAPALAHTNASLAR